MKYVFCDRRVPEEMKQQLKAFGFVLLCMGESHSLSKAVSSHVDLNVLKIGKTLVVREEVARCFPFLRTCDGVVISAESTLPRYPEEAKFCAKVVGDTLYHGKIVAEDVLKVAKEAGLHTCVVKQGYVACNLLCLTETHAITSDPSLHQALSSHGVEVLGIREGFVSLPPYPYGFIGGACGVYGDTVYTLGNVMTHPDAEKIVTFIKACKMQCVSLGTGELFDGGGLVFWDGPSTSGVTQDTHDDGE